MSNAVRPNEGRDTNSTDVVVEKSNVAEMTSCTGILTSGRELMCACSKSCNKVIANVDDGDEEQESGTRAPRKVLDPKLPTEAEIAEHELTHLPFRSWCVHCVRGRGEALPHKRANRDGDSVSELHMDYCFLDKRDEEVQPVLVVRERDDRMTLSFLVREKGNADTYVVRRVLAFVEEIGLTGSKIIIKCDQESPIKALAVGIVKSRDSPTVIEHSPVRSSGRQWYS